jgi:hypothetical protein
MNSLIRYMLRFFYLPDDIEFEKRDKIGITLAVAGMFILTVFMMFGII